MFNSVCPIFTSCDFEKTKTFYHALGFKEMSEFVKEGYLILFSDEVQLHFFKYPQHVAAESSHGAYIRVKDANALSTEYEKLNLPKEGIPRFRKAEDKPWGVCELGVIDPDGNLLRMGHDLEN